MPREIYRVKQFQQDLRLRGWLMADLARASGVSKPTISRFMRGDQSPRIAQKLADALGYPLARYLRRVRGTAGAEAA